MSEIDGVRLPFLPVGGINTLNKGHNLFKPNAQNNTFGDIFQDELNKVKFSAHAQSRMQSRDISLNESGMNRLQNAIQKAEQKGCNESMVLLDSNAYIVSVPNKTVITVVNPSKMDDNVITNIDSAVIA